jgi:hypothetical protein
MHRFSGSSLEAITSSKKGRVNGPPLRREARADLESSCTLITPPLVDCPSCRSLLRLIGRSSSVLTHHSGQTPGRIRSGQPDPLAA